LETRWVLPGPLAAAVREWFARFPATTEPREDTYLLQPPLPGLSVKLRGGSALEVKAYLGSPGILDLPGRCRGRLESWRKWSFPYDPPDRADAAPAGWVVVSKKRRSAWFPLAVSQDRPAPSQSAAQPGCAVELTEVHVRGEPWWSVGIEATGSASLLDDALGHAAKLVFAPPLPPGIWLSLEHSRSYAQWLGQLESAASTDPV
jgi:hypothetical protein